MRHAAARIPVARRTGACSPLAIATPGAANGTRLALGRVQHRRASLGLVGLKVEDVELVRGTWVRSWVRAESSGRCRSGRAPRRCCGAGLTGLARPDDPVFPNRWGRPMTRSAVEKRLRLAVSRCHPASVARGRRVSPHTLRHTTAMHMLQSGVDVTTLALWLGHADPATTHGYVEADLAMKEKALLKLQPAGTTRRRFRAGDRLLAFLDNLAGRPTSGPIMRTSPS